MNIITRIIRKLFLVSEIKSQEGELHFQRFRLFACAFFRIYLHKIYLPDYDLHFHSHPWNFFSLILKGCYWERFTCAPKHAEVFSKIRAAGSIVRHKRTDVHHIETLGASAPVWTMVFGYGKYETWGYRFKKNISSEGFDTWVDHRTYRKMKNTDCFDLYGNLIKPVLGQN